MTDKTKELEKCEHNVYVQNCDICRTKELEEINISKKFIDSKEFSRKEKDLFIDFIRRLARKETLEEVEKIIQSLLDYGYKEKKDNYL